MIVRARFFGDLKNYTEKSWMTMEIPKGSSVRTFIFELTKNIDSNLLEALMEKDKIRPGIIILVNGRNIAHLSGLESELKDHDLISILPIAGGG